jgi:tetratricopeptide (TPR) repeat protein
MSDSINSGLDVQSITQQIMSCQGEERFALLARRAKCYRLINDKRAIGDYIDIVDGSSEPSLVCHAQSMLALISIEANELKEALWWAMSAWNANEMQFDGRMAVGLALDASKLHDAAIPFFKSALELDGTSEIALLKLANSCREAMRFVEADDAFRHLITISPFNPKYHYECGRNWQLRHDVDNHYERALDFYEKALKCNPTDELKRRIEEKIQAITS